MVIDAAFEIAREQGIEQVLVKNLSERLNCSTQPIYSYMKNMNDLRLAVEKKTAVFVDEFVRKRIDADDLFRSIGRAHLALSQEEPHLFKIFILQTREEIAGLQDLVGEPTGVDLYIARQLGISVSAAQTLHLNMLIYTTGLGVIMTGSRPGIPVSEIQEKQDQAYEAFLALARRERM